MEYDREKDKKISEELIDRGKYKIAISIYSYDGGRPKIQLGKKIMIKGEERYAKLGRITKEDAKALTPILNQITEDIPDEVKTKKEEQKELETEKTSETPAD